MKFLQALLSNNIIYINIQILIVNQLFAVLVSVIASVVASVVVSVVVSIVLLISAVFIPTVSTIILTTSIVIDLVTHTIANQRRIQSTTRLILYIIVHTVSSIPWASLGIIIATITLVISDQCNIRHITKSTISSIKATFFRVMLSITSVISNLKRIFDRTVGV